MCRTLRAGVSIIELIAAAPSSVYSVFQNPIYEFRYQLRNGNDGISLEKSLEVPKCTVIGTSPAGREL
jgi:hypothetical protein